MKSTLMYIIFMAFMVSCGEPERVSFNAHGPFYKSPHDTHTEINFYSWELNTGSRYLIIVKGKVYRHGIENENLLINKFKIKTNDSMRKPGVYILSPNGDLIRTELTVNKINDIIKTHSFEKGFDDELWKDKVDPIIKSISKNNKITIGRT